MRCIDADALEDVLEKIPAADIKNIDGQAYVLVRLSQVFNVIEHAPTIEPERKTGQWIRWYETKEDETGTEYIPHCRCSECGTEYDPHSSKFVSFCNVCGAKMEEGGQNG